MKLLNVLKHYSDTLWIYHVDDDQFCIYHDTLTPEFIGQTVDVKQIHQLYQEQFLYPLDIALWEQTMNSQNLRDFYASKQEQMHFYLRFKTGNKLEWHEVFVEPYETHQLLISSRNIHEQIKSEAIEKAVEKEFDYVTYINLDEMSYVLYSAPDTKGNPIPARSGIYYADALREYNLKFVIAEEWESLTEHMEVKHVLRELENKDEYVLYATLQDEQQRRSYKKLRYCYLDDTKKVLLLTRIDISDIHHEQILRQQAEQRQQVYQQKLSHYLTNMPIAYCTVQLLFDETGKPNDFIFTYANREYTSLVKLKEEELLGKTFYGVFDHPSDKWLLPYYETAYLGVEQVLDEYSPELDKHLLIHTFQPEYGYCGCVVQDLSVRKQLEAELDQNQKRIQALLRSTADHIFQYDADSDRFQLLFTDENDGHGKQSLAAAQTFFIETILEEAYVPAFHQAIRQLIDGDNEVSLIAKGKLHASTFRWYKISLFNFTDLHTHQRQIFGYMIDINELVIRQESLAREASSDPLTGILNTKSGKLKISELLDENQEPFNNLLFLMDIDDFKTINDTQGHMIGDQVLIQFAELLKHTFRNEDIVFRLGGDEFVAFIRTDKDPIQVVEKVMRRFYEGLNVLKVNELTLSSSIGVFVSDRFSDFNYYYRHADEALYQVKRSGKSTYKLLIDEEVQKKLNKTDTTLSRPFDKLEP